MNCLSAFLNIVKFCYLFDWNRHAENYILIWVLQYKHILTQSDYFPSSYEKFGLCHNIGILHKKICNFQWKKTKGKWLYLFKINVSNQRLQGSCNRLPGKFLFNCVWRLYFLQFATWLNRIFWLTWANQNT